MQRLTDIVFWISLCAWFALAFVGGFAAMAVFPTARELPLSMDGLEAFIAVDPVQGRQMVAGHLVERVFAMSEQPRLLCAAVVALALLVQLTLAKKPPLARLRLSALAVAAGALLIGAFYLMPAFKAKDGEYRAAAAAPETIPQAIELKASVDSAHEQASRAATAEFGALLVLVALSAAAGGGAARRG